MSEQGQKIKRKQCNECLDYKELTEFHKMRESPDGVQKRCKVCQLESIRRNKAKKKAALAADPGVAYGGKIPDTGDMWHG